MRRFFPVILAALVLTAIISGCSAAPGSAAAPTSAAVTPAPASSTPPPAASTPAPTAQAPAEKTDLVLWHYFTPADPLVKQIDKYQALPAGMATIEQLYIPRQELLQKYTLGVVSNELPDIAMVDNPDSCGFEAMGMFVDITDRFNAWDDNKFYDGPINSGRYKDKQYTLPVKSNCIALWTNDKMFKAAGIDKIPTTWDELNDICAKLKAANPSVYPIVFCALKTEEGTFQLLPFIQSAGGSIDTMGSPEAIKALEFLTNLVKNKYASPEVISWTQNDGSKQFQAGNAAMAIMTPNQINNVKTGAPDLEFTISLLPKDKEYASSLGGENFGITKVCKNVDAAWDFLKFFCSTDVSIEFSRESNVISPHSNVTADILYPGDENMMVYVKQLAYAKPRGPHPAWTQVSEAVQIAIQESITGARSPADAAKGAADKIAAINAKIK